MKNKKSSLCISGMIAVISIACLVFLQFRCYEWIGIYGGTTLLSNLRQIGLAITGGLFTSAVVTFLISISEYKHERTEALESVYYAAQDLERKFSKITYFLPKEPEILVSNLLGELDNNEHDAEFNSRLAEAVSNFKNLQEADEVYAKNCIKLEHDAEHAFRDYVWEHTNEQTKKIYQEPLQIEEYLDEECAKKVKKYREQLVNTLRSFLVFQEVSTKDLGAAYARMDFAFSNKTIRKHIHEKLYSRLWEEVKLIKDANYHFKLYLDRKGGNSAVQCSIVFNLQKTLLSEDKDWYYRKFSFDLATEMVQILVYANGKTNIDEFPKIDEYKLHVKPGYFHRIHKQLVKER